MTRPAPRVLIVDDEESLLCNLARAARGCGFGVDTAKNGEEAWDRLRRTVYDVVVTDLRMPRMDGPELLDRIHRDRLGTRVVVITGYATLEAAVDCLRKGAVDFLVKPFEVEVFLDSVTRALERPGEGAPAGPNWAAVAVEFELTPREGVVLECFYRTGKSNRELAEELCLSPHTVKSHLRAAFLKLGVANRAQLLHKLRSLG